MTKQSRIDENKQAPQTFGDELKSLLSGLGWGVRWLTLSLAWGCCLFAFMAMILYAILGGNIPNAVAYYGLIIVLGLMAAILTFWRRRYR